MQQLQQAAGDYEAVSQTLSEKYKVPIFTGKTGWLNAGRLAEDDILNSLGLRRGQNFLRLPNLVMSVTTEKNPPRRIGMPVIRLWENIGPMKGGFYSEQQNKYTQVMALVRVVDIKEAEVPETIDVEFDIQGVYLGSKPVENETYSLKDAVKDDLRLLDAMETAKGRAEALSELVTEKGWNDAITAYNEQYGSTDPNVTSEQTIELDSVEQQLRRSQAEIDMIKRMMAQNPAAAQYIQQQLINNMLTNELYTLLPDDAESTGIIHTVLTFEPQEAVLVVKQVQRQPATTKDYMDNKAQTALQLSTMQAASLALEHFSCEKILQRMNYQPKRREEPQPAKPIEQQAPAEDTEA